MEYVTRQGQAALIACPIRGTPGGTRALCQGRKRYTPRYTFQDKHGQAFTASVLVCRVFPTARRTGRLPRQAEWRLFVALGLTLSPRDARHLYSHRFGIETSYRCEGQGRGWTTAKNPAYRVGLLALAFGLLNVWMLLRWRFTQVPRRGGWGFDTHRFPLRRFVLFLQYA
jgi:hypothetical protein